MALGHGCTTSGCDNEAAVDRSTCHKCRWAKRTGRAAEPEMRLTRIGERYDADGNFKGTYKSFVRPLVEPLRPAAPVKVHVKLPKRRPKGDAKLVVCLPDPQIGYRRLDDGTTEAFHDEAALAAALQVVAHVQPDVVVHLGDLVDFAALSRFAQEPGFAGTTQAGVDRAHRFLAETRAVSQGAGHYLMEGNHDIRATRWMAKHSPELARVRPVGAKYPAVSIPAFLRLEELGVEYVDGYPAGRLWLRDDLVIKHGDKVNSAGSTAAMEARAATACTVLGHVHRTEYHAHAFDTAAGPKLLWAASPGTLARKDGAVPSFHSGTHTADGSSVQRTESWQQGVGLITLIDGVLPLWEQVPIIDGVPYLRGRAL